MCFNVEYLKNCSEFYDYFKNHPSLLSSGKLSSNANSLIKKMDT